MSWGLTAQIKELKEENRVLKEALHYWLKRIHLDTLSDIERMQFNDVADFIRR